VHAGGPAPRWFFCFSCFPRSFFCFLDVSGNCMYLRVSWCSLGCPPTASLFPAAAMLFRGARSPRFSLFSLSCVFGRSLLRSPQSAPWDPTRHAGRQAWWTGGPPPSASISLVRFGSLGFSGSFRPALRSVMVRSRRAASGAAKRLLGRSPTWIQCAPGPGRRGGLGGPRFGATAREWLALAHGGCREAGCKGGCRGGLVSRVVLQGSCTGGCRVGARIHAGTPAARIHAGTPAASNIPAPRGASGRIWMSFVS
jgi:hypothetical protein